MQYFVHKVQKAKYVFKTAFFNLKFRVKTEFKYSIVENRWKVLSPKTMGLMWSYFSGAIIVTDSDVNLAFGSFASHGVLLRADSKIIANDL